MHNVNNLKFDLFELKKCILSFIKNKNNLNPYWICGFIVVNGFFYTLYKTKHNINLYINIHLHIKEKDLLLKIQKNLNGLSSIDIKHKSI